MGRSRHIIPYRSLDSFCSHSVVTTELCSQGPAYLTECTTVASSASPITAVYELEQLYSPARQPFDFHHLDDDAKEMPSIAIPFLR